MGATAVTPHTPADPHGRHGPLVRHDPAFYRRLARLTEDGPEVYAARLQQDADTVRTSPRFQDRVAIFKALADPTRLLICALLKRSDALTATEIQAALGLTHATVSHHMGALQEAGLVKARRFGRWVRYKPDPALFPLFP